MALRAGTEDKRKVYLAVGLGVVMLLLLGRFLWQTFGPSSPPPAAPPTVATAPASNPQTEAPAASASYDSSGPSSTGQPHAHEALKVASSALDPTLHPEIMRQAESLEYTGSGRNIFSFFSAPPTIPKAVAPARPIPVNTAPPPPPPPPPINLRFYGYAAEKDGKKQIFLLQGEDIFIASEGDVVDRRYRVAKIAATSVQVEDLPYHDTQTLPLMQ
ncbi:MAG TPA: hypothetical protein VHX11_07505 [Acidobacteriaceae bacterium]|nr:hypothetical protein [Acidobacteriaceae bacterium]